MKSVKEHVHAMLERLPDDCQMDDIYYQLSVLDKLLISKEDVRQGRVIPHEDIERKLQAWRESNDLKMDSVEELSDCAG